MANESVPRKILIIGGVAAGLKSAAKARRCDPKAQITVLERGNLISYGACGMPYVVAGDVPSIQNLLMTTAGAVRDPAYFKNTKNLDVRTGIEALSIDRAGKTVRVRDLSSGEESMLDYDKLVIATGATPVKLPLPGNQLANIFQMWHPNDAKAVKGRLEKGAVKNAVVMGAGLIGIEMAEAFHCWGVHVAVVEMLPQIFPAMLDPEIALAVEKYAREQGVEIRTGEKVLEFRGQDAVQEIVTDKGVIPADLVIQAVGVRPNVGLAKAAGLDIGPSGAIAVNEHMQTSDPDIYAGGDCAENTHRITGKKMFTAMGSTANKHGRVIGENLCGGAASFGGILGTGVVQLLDLNIGKSGLTEREAKEAGYECITTMTGGHDRAHYMPGAKFITVKLIAEAKTGKLLGIQAFGEGEVAKRIDVVATLITMGGTVQDLIDVDLGYAPPYNNPIDNAAVAANTLLNKIDGKFKGISPLEAKEKMASPETVFLDVRTPDECKTVRIADCRNIKYIPLGQLRSRLEELNKDDEIVAFCKISLRGFEAECMLEGEGFTHVQVMEGGVVAWPFACETGKVCENSGGQK